MLRVVVTSWVITNIVGCEKPMEWWSTVGREHGAKEKMNVEHSTLNIEC